MDFGKNSATFKMFGDYYSLIKTLPEAKNEQDVKDIKKAVEDWVIDLPQEVQIFGLCLASAYAKKCDYDLMIAKGTMPKDCIVTRNEKGYIAIRGNCIP